MKYFFIILLFFAFAPEALAFNKPNENRAYKHFQKLDEVGGFKAVYDYLQSGKQQEFLSKPEDIESFGVWLRDIHFNPDKDLRYGFLYASHMRELSDAYSKKGIRKVSEDLKGVSALSYFVALLKMNNSVSRCDDVNVGMRAKLAWAPKNSDYKELFLTIDPSKRTEWFDIIVQHAEKSVKSEPVVWVCLDGASVMSKAIQADEEEQKIEDPEGLGRNYAMVDTSKYVEFISDEAWKKKRDENVEKLKKYLLDSD
ncbi:MAG: hypothetical protein H6868_07710 [Rhodospirillales bacterium]|nr:hypothetical protein [Rhodospirillales bacterium]